MKKLGLLLILIAGLLVPCALGYSGTSNITAATVNDARVDPSAAVMWTVGPIYNGTENPIQNGWGMNYNGINEATTINDDASIRFGQGNFTVSAWFNKETQTGSFDSIVAKGQTGGGEWSLYFFTSTTLRFYADGGTIDLNYGVGDLRGNYHQVTVTKNWTDAVMYLDGVELGRDTSVNVNLNTVKTLSIGASSQGASRFFNGTIDELLIYNRSIGTGEIQYSYQHKVPLNQTGLVLWTDFDQNIQDQSGNGNNGALIGAPSYVRGIRGKAGMVFDSNGDWVQVPDDPSLDIIEDISIEAWINPFTFGTTGFGRIWDKNTYILYLDDGTDRIVFALPGVTGTPFSSDINIVNTNILQHLIVTREKSTGNVIFYIDTVESGTVAGGNENITPNNDPIKIGDRFIGGREFNGTIDEFRIYNRTLSITEVAEHYQGIYSNETGLVLYLDFDGQVQDHSGEGNNGAVNGDPEYSDGWANCPVSTSYNGTGGTTVELVNCTTGLCSIPDTAPATYGNYTVNATVPAASANATYLGFIADHYLVDLHTSYGETEAGFRALITATGESVIDEHEVAYDDALNVAGVGAMTWSNYTDCFQDTVTSNIATTVTYDTVTSFLEATYGITSAEINTTVTVTWTTSTLDRLQTKFMTGDWIGAIFDEEAYLVGTLTLYTFILGTISIAVWNVTGPYGTFVAWLLGWIIFAATIHGPAQSMALLLFALGCGIMLAKLYLDRRTT